MAHHNNGTVGVRASQDVAPFQARGFTVAERHKVRKRLREDYRTEAAGGRAVLRAFARSLSLRRLVLEASKPFTDPTRINRPDRDGEIRAPTLYLEGFDAAERQRIGVALTDVYLTESQGLRSCALAYLVSEQVRDAVQKLVPPLRIEGDR